MNEATDQHADCGLLAGYSTDRMAVHNDQYTATAADLLHYSTTATGPDTAALLLLLLR